ncbi:hypothetical protein O6H91_10G076700 [Diphasiastrum complanatum]|uniref:Uncharacterized protein n=1 Tax=Diphasiastrum complanatum TaxID=34168 RepID=A0ACC2CII1_DIPCM|nr:hypothetical protein O6H91_10G076700 [Diphasiastrum complanatum]
MASLALSFLPSPCSSSYSSPLSSSHCIIKCPSSPFHRQQLSSSLLGLKKIGWKKCSPPAHQKRKHHVTTQAALLDALLFDCDGVLVDTERDGHRISFNQTFAQNGLDVAWDVDLYGELLKIGGGKERMAYYFNKVGWPKVAPSDFAEQRNFIASLHKQKTVLFMNLIQQGALPLRPGVARLVDEALSNNVKVGICSTSNEKAVSGIVRVLLGSERADSISIFAGDVVPRKKPDPAIYLLAAETLQVLPSRCIVIEDSAIGLQAAKAAGMMCIVTRSGYTAAEDFTWADAVFDNIGDPPNVKFDLEFCKHLLSVKSKSPR